MNENCKGNVSMFFGVFTKWCPLLPLVLPIPCLRCNLLNKIRQLSDFSLHFAGGSHWTWGVMCLSRTLISSPSPTEWILACRMFRFTQTPSQQMIILFIELKQLHSVNQNYQYDSEYRRDKNKTPPNIPENFGKNSTERSPPQAKMLGVFFVFYKEQSKRVG